ncbi:MAG: GldG family protein [Pseudomonadota bacterium]|nr:GldG family protein [Pseudomonadota bacterium]
MQVTPQSRWRLRLENVLFLLLFIGVIGLLAWLSTIYKFQADWTFGNRNSLSPDTQRILAAIHEPMSFVAFVPDDPALHKRIEENLAKYQRFKPDIKISFTNPDLEPEVAHAAGITSTGQLLLRVGSRTEIVDDLSEQTLFDALQQLARGGERSVVFLQGHGERDPLAGTNPGYSRLDDSLTRSGIRVRPLTLLRNPRIPKNTRLLVLASPKAALLKGEVKKLREYVAGGGNLLWLSDPNGPTGLQPLAEELGVKFVNGVIVDANAELRALLGIQHPAVVPVLNYGQHAITQEFDAQTLFPFTMGLEIDAHSDLGWQADPILTTTPRTWAETGSLAGKEITFSSKSGDRAGPFTIGLALSRDRGKVQQRVAVIGDSDFLTNGYIGHGNNLQLGVNLFNWLTRDDTLIAISPKSAPDTQLVLGNTAIIVIAFTFLAVLPIGLLTIGTTIWMRRRRR